jgi:hypothetical protein
MKIGGIRIEIDTTDELIAAESGLTLMASLLQKTRLQQRLEPTGKRSQIPDFAILKSYAGLLAMGKTEFAKIEQFRDDDFFRIVLGLKAIPSEEILRQRLDQAPESWALKIIEEGNRLIRTMQGPITPSIDDLIPLDIDVSPFDNSDTKKEGVSRTYAGFDGYAPNFAYLGKHEGWCVNVEFREGKRHTLCDQGAFVRQSIRNAKEFTQKILVRMDSGNDSIDVLRICSEEEKTDFILKRNLRKDKPESYLERIRKSPTAVITNPREGKTVWRDNIEADVGLTNTIRMVYEVIERTIDKKGQMLLVPDIEVKAYWTSLDKDADTVIRLYQEHGTSEQFHSEIKSDIGLERFPSGKFNTNRLVLVIACLVYNMLRWAGQYSLRYRVAGGKPRQRIRLKTIIQDIVYLAAKLVKHARKWVLKIRSDLPHLEVFRGLAAHFSN